MDIRMHKFSDKVPEPTLRRLPWYLSNVKLMKEQGETYVSSTQISKQINVDASQTTDTKQKSFMHFGKSQETLQHLYQRIILD